MPEWLKTVFRGVCAVGVLVGFAVLTAIALRDVIDAKPGIVPKYSDWFTYIATALSAFVGGIMAVTFGQAPPPPPPPPGGNLGATNYASASLSHFSRVVFGNAAVTALTVVYILTYIGFGIAAVAVWAANADEASTVVKTLAVTFVGLALPMAQGFFRPAAA